jgi:hypothetical protein
VLPRSLAKRLVLRSAAKLVSKGRETKDWVFREAAGFPRENSPLLKRIALLGAMEKTSRSNMSHEKTTDKNHQGKGFSLEILWNSRMAVLSGGKSPRPLTPKERGQLKYVANQLGPYTREVIVFILDNWTKFAKQAEWDDGLLSYPAESHVGLLVAHLRTALGMMPTVAETLGRWWQEAEFKSYKLMQIKPEELAPPAWAQKYADWLSKNS